MDLASPSRLCRSTSRSRPGAVAISSSAAAARRRTWIPSSRLDRLEPAVSRLARTFHDASRRCRLCHYCSALRIAADRYVNLWRVA